MSKSKWCIVWLLIHMCVELFNLSADNTWIIWRMGQLLKGNKSYKHRYGPYLNLQSGGLHYIALTTAPLKFTVSVCKQYVFLCFGAFYFSNLTNICYVTFICSFLSQSCLTLCSSILSLNIRSSISLNESSFVSSSESIHITSSSSGILKESQMTSVCLSSLLLLQCCFECSSDKVKMSVVLIKVLGNFHFSVDVTVGFRQDTSVVDELFTGMFCDSLKYKEIWLFYFEYLKSLLVITFVNVSVFKKNLINIGCNTFYLLNMHFCISFLCVLKHYLKIKNIFSQKHGY